MIVATKAMLLMGAIFSLAVIFLGAHLSYLAATVALVAVIMRILVALDFMAPPSRRVVRALSIVGLIAIAIFKILGGAWGDASVSLLILGCALKFLEINNKRDALVQCTAIFFLSSVPYIFHYEVYIALYLLLVPLMSLWSYLAISANLSIKQEVKILGLLTSCAIPLVLVLFIGLPRPAGLWSLPQSLNKNIDVSGISEEFSPNEVSSLVRRGDLAARVIFDGNIPNIRYFKAVTYEFNAGSRWYPSRSSRDYQMRLRYMYRPKDEVTRPFKKANAQKYRVMVEGRGSQFIPALSESYSTDKSIFYLKGGTYVTREAFSSRLAVDFEYPGTIGDDEPTGAYLRELLFVHPKQNLRTWDLVSKLEEQNLTQKELANKIFMTFATGYKYTLEPGSYGSNAVDELIFERKQGFCGHYAHALAVMFRMAKIPARIAGGYVGGKVNTNYVILRDFDAHAWTEAYIDGKWQRFDVVPMLNSNAVGRDIEEVLQAPHNPSMKFTEILAQVREYLDYHWSVWVINFNEESRLSFVKSGLNILVLVLVILGFCWGLYVIGLYHRRLNKADIEVELTLKFFKNMQKLGYEIQTGDDLWRFYERVYVQITGVQGVELNQDLKCSENENQLLLQLREAAMIYDQLRYAFRSSKEQKELRQKYIILLEKILHLAKSSP